VKVETSDRVRHLLLRAEEGDLLPEALVRALTEHKVVVGWLRGTGILTDVELKADSADLAGHGAQRHVAGPVQILFLEGAVRVANGDVGLGLRAVFSQETEHGVETLAGELASARIVGLEVLVTAMDDLAALRPLDPHANAPSTSTTSAPWVQPSVAARGGSPGWSDAVAASASPPKDKTARAGQPVPVRPARPVVQDDDDGPSPKAGDMVEHFAFGTCEVLKSDGDRLHLRVGKDERIREIALEMLRVTVLSTDGESHRYRLDRKM
jgi:predicted DNA-binding protein with PD1-like motif